MDRRTLLAGLAAIGLSGRSSAAAIAGAVGSRPPEGGGEPAGKTMPPLPYEVVTVAGAQAEAEWQRLRGAGRGWPVVVGGDEALAQMAEMLGGRQAQAADGGAPSPGSPAEIVKAAAALRFPEALRAWAGAPGEDELRAEDGAWPEDLPSGAAMPGLILATDLTSGAPLERVHLLLIPTAKSWEVPAYLAWGGWNACPPPAVHVAALKAWHERYGAELVGLNGDTLNLRVARRPTERAEALALARDFYRYCPDIVDQGTGTLAPLAAGLMTSDWWYFWWD
ncbi:DUF4253 domain-containing protein [Allosphingosinicella deserti]|uniref:DUF4253 domain-containing protein n=1 Tax=Allosphingosinicella deserti TaxID=2116704 RepID=A0A2P7QRJ7_9SPHN|nr:DUF4253 domain-containing protein [Sphingomonas deserti]PSJ40585.1 hypothetical protein C7I55_09670 [Sphingomonas deserti]